MIENEQYVDYNKKPLELLGYQFVRLEVAGVTVSKARVLAAPNSGMSIVGRDWLIALRYRLNQPIERGECERIDKNVNCVHPVNEVKNVNCVNSINEAESEGQLSPEMKQLMGDFPKLFTRKGRVKNYEIKIKMKANARISQQKGRRVPIQLQNQVDAEINKLLKEGHIEKSVKIALDARALNESVAKDKYQMPNLDNLIELIAEI